MDAETLVIIGAVLAAGFGLAGLMIRTTARLDRRIDNDKAAAEADRGAFQDAMAACRTEMQRLAERQSHVEGRVGGRGAAAGPARAVARWPRHPNRGDDDGNFERNGRNAEPARSHDPRGGGSEPEEVAREHGSVAGPAPPGIPGR